MRIEHRARSILFICFGLYERQRALFAEEARRLSRPQLEARPSASNSKSAIRWYGNDRKTPWHSQIIVCLQLLTHSSRVHPKLSPQTLFGFHNRSTVRLEPAREAVWIRRTRTNSGPR
jgi:hypothetical protein